MARWRWVAVDNADHQAADGIRLAIGVFFAEVDLRPRNVVVLEPGAIPKTPSGKLWCAHALTLVN